MQGTLGNLTTAPNAHLVSEESTMIGDLTTGFTIEYCAIEHNTTLTQAAIHGINLRVSVKQSHDVCRQWCKL